MDQRKKPASQAFIAGFSLIELVVAIGIMIVLIGGGLAAFIRFNQKQQLLSSSRELQQLIRTAQNKAKSREVPEDWGDCDVEDNPIVAYRVFSVGGDGARIMVLPICGTSLTGYSDPAVDSSFLSMDLTTGVTLVEPMQLDFLALQGGVINTGASTFHLTFGDYEMMFSVSEGGAISDVVDSE